MTTLFQDVRYALYEITSADSQGMLVAVLMLALAACVAGIIPAERAVSVDLAQALRME